jgi:glucose-1-phosphate adenylyltransferase
MDYSLMLEFHQDKEADVTIGVIEVPWDEASRFGIMSSDENYRITQFDEKPAQPKSNHASMGIYIFSWPILRKYLLDDENDTRSSHDFGKDIIPKLLRNQAKLVAYPFEGYWKDVGTVESFWQANMDLLGEKSQLNMYDSNWRIYSANPPRPPHYIAATAKVKSSIISEGCLAFGQVKNSVIFPDVYIGEGAVVKNSVIMAGAHIEDNVVIDKAIIGRKTVIKQGAVVSAAHELDGQQIVVVAADMVIPPHTIIKTSISRSANEEFCGKEEEQL